MGKDVQRRWHFESNRQSDRKKERKRRRRKKPERMERVETSNALRRVLAWDATMILLLLLCTWSWRDTVTVGKQPHLLHRAIRHPQSLTSNIFIHRYAQALDFNQFSVPFLFCHSDLSGWTGMRRPQTWLSQHIYSSIHMRKLWIS